MYKSSFCDRRISPKKNTLDLYMSHTQRPGQPANNNCLKSVRQTEFIKPVRILSVFRHFSAHSSSSKKFEIINFEWLNTRLLELISVVSSDSRTDIFSYSFAVVYSAELSISSNDYSSLVTWQMLLSHAILLFKRDLALYARSCSLRAILLSYSVFLRFT